MVPALQTSLQQPTYSSWNISVGDGIVLRFRREARCFQRKFNHQCCSVGMLVVRCDLSSMVANNRIADTKSHADTAPRGLCREKGIESSLRVGKSPVHCQKSTPSPCHHDDLHRSGQSFAARSHWDQMHPANYSGPEETSAAADSCFRRRTANHPANGAVTRCGGD